MEDLTTCIFDRVRSWLYESKSKGTHPIMNFKKLAYEIITWFCYKDLIENRNILKTKKVIDYLTEDEKRKLKILERQLIFLISTWFDLKGIKALKLKIF